MKSRNIDKLVKEAFDELVTIATGSNLLSDIARHPKSRQEETIEGFFRTILRAKLKSKIKVHLGQCQESYGCEHDIVGMRKSRTALAVEIKTPFTNSGGIHFKTERPEGLPKDINSLGTALDNGVQVAYELVVMYGCCAVNKRGKRIQGNKAHLWQKYGIRYPTKSGYVHREGEKQVNDALKGLARDRGLKVTRLKGWQNVLLPSPQPNIRTFLDCALYKVQPR